MSEDRRDQRVLFCLSACLDVFQLAAGCCLDSVDAGDIRKPAWKVTALRAWGRLFLVVELRRRLGGAGVALMLFLCRCLCGQPLICRRFGDL